MGSPDDPAQGEPPDLEPPYRPWPGEQVPYQPTTSTTSTTVSFAAGADDDIHDIQPPRRRRRRLRSLALLFVVVGISVGAVLFVGDRDNGAYDDGTTSGSIGEDDIEPTDDYLLEDETPFESESPTEEDTPTETPTETPTDDYPDSTEQEETFYADLSTGECADEAGESATYEYYVVIGCDELHDTQVLDVGELEDSILYPGLDAITEEADSACAAAYVAAEQWWPSDQTATLTWGWVAPDSEEWDVGYRTVVCLLLSGDGGYLDRDWVN